MTFNLTELLKTNETLVKELADVKVQLRIAVEGLKKISNEDFRGNRSPGSQDAFAALEKIDRKFK